MWNRLIYLATIALLFTVVPVLAQSQQHDATNPGQMVVQEPGTSSTQVVHPLPPSPRHFYRLDFVLREMDDGKPLNQRTFTMSVSADPADTRERTWWNLRAGTRLPVRDPNGTNYVDVGVNLDITARDAENALQLEVTAEISSVVTEAGSNTAPPIRQLKVKGAVFAPLGKQTLVFTAEDPASRHQFELQVTPVRAR
jgi:hypothetical protein